VKRCPIGSAFSTTTPNFVSQRNPSVCARGRGTGEI
jgi:hypothetical protein